MDDVEMPATSEPGHDDNVDLLNASTAEPDTGTPEPVGCLKLSRYGVGVVLLVLVAIIWVAASEWIQWIFGDLHFDKPFFLTYLNTTMFSLWNVGYFVVPWWREVPWSDDDVESDDDGGDSESPRPYTMRELAKCALMFCPFWFLANVLFNYSLSRTSVSSNTILSTTSSIWTLLFARVFLGQEVRLFKVAALLLTIGGTVMVGLGDEHHSGKDSLVGDVLALTSAFFYATYTTVLKWCLPDEERYAMGMVFGMVGVANMLMMWPGFLILHYTGVEPFELPGWAVLWPLMVNTLIGTNLSDVMWAKAVVLTSPFVATIGLSLTTPFALMADLVIHGAKHGPLYITGAVVVTAGFVVANV